jgi:flagellar motor switch protein FliG
MPPKAKTLHLSDEDKQQIITINKTITTVPREQVQATQELLFSTLQNGNPLNRLLRDSETNHIIGFLAAKDTTDDKGNKIAYF